MEGPTTDHTEVTTPIIGTIETTIDTSAMTATIAQRSGTGNTIAGVTAGAMTGTAADAPVTAQIAAVANGPESVSTGAIAEAARPAALVVSGPAQSPARVAVNLKKSTGVHDSKL